MKGMVDPAIKDQILEDLEALTPEQQREAARRVHSLRGVPAEPSGRKLLKYAGIWDEQTAKEVADAIEEGCEQVDPDGR